MRRRKPYESISVLNKYLLYIDCLADFRVLPKFKCAENIGEAQQSTPGNREWGKEKETVAIIYDR